MWKDELFRALVEQRDSEQAREMSRYMRYAFPFLGVRRPARQLLYNTYYKDLPLGIDWDFIADCYSRPEREFQYLAIDYLNVQKRFLEGEDLSRIAHWIMSKSWWDSVDGYPRILSHLADRVENMGKVMLGWSLHEDFWLRRAAILHQLLRREKTDVDLLENILANNFHSQEFFINKAMGWSLREYSKTNPTWVAQFILKHHEELAPLTIREASKYIKNQEKE